MLMLQIPVANQQEANRYQKTIYKIWQHGNVYIVEASKQAVYIRSCEPLWRYF
jgi:predicted outer membrane protein